MTEKYPIGSVWKTRGGQRSVVVEHSTDKIMAYCDGGIYSVLPNGSAMASVGLGGGSYDLIEPWQEPRSGEVWIDVCNIDGQVVFGIHDTKEGVLKSYEYSHLQNLGPYDDDRPSDGEPLARIRVTWTEGHFDE